MARIAKLTGRVLEMPRLRLPGSGAIHTRCASGYRRLWCAATVRTWRGIQR